MLSQPETRAGSPWITAIGVPHLLRAMADAGGDAAALAARIGIGPDPTFADRIPVASVIDGWEAAIAATGRRDLPLLAATRAEHDERSLLAFVVANQPRLGDGIARLDRYYPTASSVHCWRLAIADGELHVTCTPPGPIHRLGWQAYLEFELADTILSADRITGGRARPTAVRLLHPRPADMAVAQLARIAGIAPAFSQDACEIVYPSHVTELVLPTARPALAALIEDQLAALLDADARNNAVSTRARLAIPALLRDRRCSVVDLARALHMSRRSLERALASEGTSAGALIEDHRRELALAWLPTLTVDEVASRLGYADTRAFARAFKRWTGHPPREHRRRS